VSARPNISGLAGLLVAALPAVAAGPDSRYPAFDDARLKVGRAVWLETCRECHGNPMSDAPQVKDAANWAGRAAKGRAVLYAHALNGFEGASGTEMPARGANPALTDEEVKAAVDYMVRIAVP
jgi:cytochrome c5